MLKQGDILNTRSQKILLVQNKVPRASSGKHFYEKRTQQILEQYSKLKQEIQTAEYSDLQMHKKHASKERIKQLISAGMILEQAGLLNLSDDEKEKLLFHLYQFKKELFFEDYHKYKGE